MNAKWIIRKIQCVEENIDSVFPTWFGHFIKGELLLAWCFPSSHNGCHKSPLFVLTFLTPQLSVREMQKEHSDISTTPSVVAHWNMLSLQLSRMATYSCIRSRTVWLQKTICIWSRIIITLTILTHSSWFFTCLSALHIKVNRSKESCNQSDKSFTYI